MKKIIGRAACLVGSLFLFWMGSAVVAQATPPSPPLDSSELSSVSIAVGSAYGSASGSSTGIITGNSLQEENIQSTTSLLSSINANTGIIGINQAAGSLNSQTSTLVLAIGGLVTLTEKELGDVSASNREDPYGHIVAICTVEQFFDYLMSRQTVHCQSYLESCIYYKSAEGGKVKEDKYALDKT